MAKCMNYDLRPPFYLLLFTVWIDLSTVNVFTVVMCCMKKVNQVWKNILDGKDQDNILH